MIYDTESDHYETFLKAYTRHMERFEAKYEKTVKPKPGKTGCARLLENSLAT